MSSGLVKRVLARLFPSEKDRTRSPSPKPKDFRNDRPNGQRSSLTRRDIQHIIRATLEKVADGKPCETSKFSSIADAQFFLDEIWKVLDSPILPDATSGGSPFYSFRNTLRKLSLRHANEYGILPTTLFLERVERLDKHQYGAGSFSNVYRGTYDGRKVALKQLKVYISSPESEKQKVKKAFYLESILWRSLLHDHIVPFLGISESVLSRSLCMVLPWYERGTLRDYIGQVGRENLDTQLEEAFRSSLTVWFCHTALGLEYLHSEGITHGDLHAGNILIDDKGNARLSDFGLSLIADASAYNYGSTHGGGAFRWLAPELIDPGHFKLQFARPTHASDIFSFACTGVEIYTGKPPLQHISSYFQVQMFYVSGNRPSRPCPPEGTAISDGLWTLIESCWAQEISARPSAQRVVQALYAVITQTSLESTTEAAIPAEQIQAPSPLSPSPNFFKPPRERPMIRKEGIGWSAMFFPPVDEFGVATRSLDVELVHTLSHAYDVTCVRFSSDGKHLAVGYTGSVHLFDMERNEITCLFDDDRLRSMKDKSLPVCFMPNGALLATGTADSLIRIWHVATQKTIEVLRGHWSGISSLEFSYDGRLLVSGSLDQTIRVWDFSEDGIPSKVLSVANGPKRSNFGVNSVCFSPDCQLVAACCGDSVVRIWDARSGQCLEILEGHQDDVHSIAFTPDGFGLISSSWDSTLKHWDLSPLLFRMFQAAIHGSDDRTSAIPAWESEERSRCVMTLAEHTDAALAVAVSHDGQWIISGSEDCGVRFWDAKTGEVECLLHGHDQWVWSVDSSPSGNILATGSYDRKIHIWRYTTLAI